VGAAPQPIRRIGNRFDANFALRSAVLTNVAVRYVLPANAVDAVTMTYSPLAELGLSLRVLGFPHKHPLKHAWLRRARRLEPELRRRIGAFRFAFRCGMPDALFPSAASSPPSFAEELGRLQSLDPAVLASELEEMLRMDKRLRRVNGAKLSGSRLAEHAIAHFGPEDMDQGAAISLLAGDPRQAVTQFVSLLEDYWNASFAEEWRQVEPLLIQANAELEPKLRQDFYGTVTRLQHRLRADSRTRSIEADVRAERTLAARADRKLMIVPSTFLWPHLMARFEPPECPGFIYPAPVSAAVAANDVSDVELLKLTKALGDATRLRALKLLARDARTTQELAPLLGITESGLSKHLRVLAEAGLVRTRRQSYYVIYSVVPERIASLSNDLLEFLDETGPGFASGESVAASANE
jgi:DNA-binding transcriptional ArsR family regulator